MLFRHHDSSRIPYPDQNDFEYHFDYASVMQFVSKNTKIPAKMNQFDDSPLDQENINKLADAIQAADLNHDIFSHPDCQLYALYLFRGILQDNKRIPQISIEDFLNINMYLCALMQFTDKQKMKEEDEKLFKRKNIQVAFCSLNDPEVRNLFYTSLSTKYSKAITDFSSLESQIALLSELGKTVIVLEGFRRAKNVVALQDMLEELSESSPWLLQINAGNSVYIGSSDLAELIMNFINPDRSVKMAPIFGNINPKTLFKMHQCQNNSVHPISLYSKYITTNPILIHDLPLGPLVSFVHDFAYHIYQGNILPRNQYRFLFEYLIPTIAKQLDVKFDDINKEHYRAVFYITDLVISEHANPFFGTENGIFMQKINAVFADGDIAPYAFELLVLIYQEKQLIKEKYQIDLDKIFRDRQFRVPYHISNERVFVDALNKTLPFN